MYGNNIDRYSYDDKDIEFLSFGIDYSSQDILFRSEISRLESYTLLPNIMAYYLMAGYRYDKIIPFIIYSRNKNDKSYYNTNHIKAVDKIGYMLKAGLEQILYSMNSSQKTTAIGLRYDLQDGIAFKLQLDKISFTDYGVNHGLDPIYDRYGLLSKRKGVDRTEVYQFTMGLSFAF